MIETLVPLALPPGMYRNGTMNEGAGRWVDGSLVRFLEGTKRPVGGWRVAQGPAGNALPVLDGVPRAVHGWRDAVGAYRLAFGTTTGLFMLAGGVLTSLTPVDFTGTPTVNGSYSPGGSQYGAGPLGASFTPAETWSLDTFGNFLVGVNTRNGNLYVQTDPAAPPTTPSGAPTGCRAVVATAERFLFVLGATGDARRVTWPDQQTTTVWTATSTNQAGDFTLSSTGALVAGVSVPAYTLLFTDVDLWAATYIGGALVYRFDKKGDNCGVIGPNALVRVDTQVYWMGQDHFFVFDGYAKPLPCDVRDYVFGDFNLAQRQKVWATSVTGAHEVWWFYPSGGSLECDRYVVYNTVEQHWTTGYLSRSAGSDATVVPFPVWLGTDGTIYEHEYGFAHGTAVPYLESGPLVFGNGDNVVRVQKFIGDTRAVGDVNVSFFTRFWPNDDEDMIGPYRVDVPSDVRFTGRIIRVRFDEATPRDWRLGTTSLGYVVGGRR